MRDYFKERWIAIAALGISFLSLFFSVFPQFKPFNDNYVEKANAGQVEAQMFLANLNYEVGNISESVKWYSVAMTHSGRYQAKAINNLAYLYLTDSRFYATRRDNVYDVMKMFRTAAELGEVEAAKNLYILLISNPRELFGEEYTEMVARAKEILEGNNIALDLLDGYQSRWKYVETTTGENVPRNNDTYKYREVGDAQYVLAKNGFCWVHTYEVYQIENVAEKPEYIYIKIN